jgi:hypothetical protein
MDLRLLILLKHREAMIHEHSRIVLSDLPKPCVEDGLVVACRGLQGNPGLSEHVVP